MTVAVEYSRPEMGWIVPFQIGASDITIANTSNPTATSVTFAIPPIFYYLFYAIMGRLKAINPKNTGPALIRVRVHCDHLVTVTGRPIRIDGNFNTFSTTPVNDKYSVKTGNGVPGGLFESWFYLGIGDIDNSDDLRSKLKPYINIIPADSVLLKSIYFAS